MYLIFCRFISCSILNETSPNANCQSLIADVRPIIVVRTSTTISVSSAFNTTSRPTECFSGTSYIFLRAAPSRLGVQAHYLCAFNYIRTWSKYISELFRPCQCRLSSGGERLEGVSAHGSG